MKNENQPEAACYHCGAELFVGDSGMISGACQSRIIPLAIYKAELIKPVRWKLVKNLGQKALRRWWSGGESRTKRDLELAKLGLKQTELFT